MVRIERARFVAGSPVHAVCVDAIGVNPDLEHDHSTDEFGVEIANVALMGDKPGKVIQVAAVVVRLRREIFSAMFSSSRTT